MADPGGGFAGDGPGRADLEWWTFGGEPKSSGSRVADLGWQTEERTQQGGPRMADLEWRTRGGERTKADFTDIIGLSSTTVT